MKIQTIFISIVSIGLITACGSSQKNETSVQPESKKIDGVTMQLPDWNQAPRTRILKWIDGATDSTSADFIPVSDRIAVFDNDGTLWPEQPYPNQFQFSLDFLKANWDKHPEWSKDPVLAGLAKGDAEPLKKAGMKGLIDVINVTHSNQSEDEFNKNVKAWADTAHDERFGKLYTEIVYAPMLELLDVLRKNDFKTFIVSGGGADFMRVFSQDVYGIPPNQVIGSFGNVKVDDKSEVTKVPGDIFVDDKQGKVEAIHRFIGQRPVLCGGNSDGDQAMMEYTSGSDYNTLCILVYHTDSLRAYKYDTKTLSGHLETALTMAKEKNWLVVDMKNDWKKVFVWD